MQLYFKIKWVAPDKLLLCFTTHSSGLCACVCARTHGLAVCCMKYVPCHTQLFSARLFGMPPVCVCVYLCARVYVWDIPGLMSSGVINRPVKWPRVLPSALLPLSQTLELVELIASHPWGGLEQFSCVALRHMTCHLIRMWKSWQYILKGNYCVKMWFIFKKHPFKHCNPISSS